VKQRRSQKGVGRVQGGNTTVAWVEHWWARGSALQPPAAEQAGGWPEPPPGTPKAAPHLICQVSSYILHRWLAAPHSG
jgi:hypothetical protein